MDPRRPPDRPPARGRVARRSGRPLPPNPTLAVECLDDRALPSAPALLLSTVADVSGAATPGLGAWLDKEVVQFGDPNLALEPAPPASGPTRGTFSSFLNLGRFGQNDSNVEATHRVSRPVRVGSGAGTFDLFPGDLLLVVDNNDTFTSLNTLSVTKDEVFVFRPAVAGDYSSGTFTILLDDFKNISGGDTTWALALVETPTVVGDVTLAAGTFLFSRKGGSEHNDVRMFVPTGVGAGRTAGAVSVLIEGDDLNYSAKIYGLDLVQQTTPVGGRTLPAGTLLMALEADDSSVGTNAVPVTRNDVFALSVSKTTLGSGTAVATASVVFEGADVGLNSGSAAIDGLALLLGPANAAPAAAGDAYATTEDAPLTVSAAAGVLANDSDPDGDPLTVSLATAPTHGTATLQANGGFTYTPSPNYTGPDSFTYTVGDGRGGTATGTVNITVAPVNDPPVAADDHYTATGGLLLTVLAPGVLANDADADGNTLATQVASGPSNGTLIPSADGSFTYLPDPLFSGSDSFTYRAWDGSSWSAPATVAINVSLLNRGPTASGDSYAATEDVPLTVAARGVLANDADPDGDTLAAVLASGPSRGTLTLSPDGSFTYTPSHDFHGTDSFTYRASDGSLTSATATVTLTVSPVDDRPTLDALPDVTVTEDGGPFTVSLTGVGSGAGNEPQSVTVTATSSDPSLLPNPVVSYASPGSTGTLALTPLANAYGSTLITVTVSDGVSSTVRQFTLVVTPVNDAPVAADDTATTAEDSAVTVGVLANDADVDGDRRTITAVGAPAHGTAVVSGGAVVYTPAADFFGTDTFTYTVSDGAGGTATATVTVSVTPMNDPPAITPIADQTIPEDGTTGPLAFTVGDVETSSGALTVTASSSNPALVPVGDIALSGGPGAGGRTVTVNPAADGYGSAVITLTVSDGTATATTSFSVTVTPVNDRPVAADDGFSTQRNTPLVVAAPGVLGNDRDADGDPLSAVLVTGPANGTLTLNPDGSLTYTPDPGYVGINTFRYRVSDGQFASQAATVTVYVSPNNDKPVAADDAYDVDEDGVLTVPGPGVLANDFDPNGNPVTAILVSDPENGTLTLNADGSFAYTPARDFYGTDSFSYKADDGTDRSSTSHVVIKVRPLGDPPSAADDVLSAAANTPLTVPLEELTRNDSDPDGDPLTVVAVTPGTHGTVTVVGSTLVYVPQTGYEGLDTFRYTVSDGNGGTATATVTVNVAAVNRAPVAVGEAYVTPGPLAVGPGGLLANDVDLDGDTLAVELVDGPTRGTLTLTPDGAFSYTPDEGFAGLDRFTYRVTDGLVTSDVVSVAITVEPVPPVPPVVPLPPVPPVPPTPLPPPGVPVPPVRPVPPAPAPPPPAPPTPTSPPVSPPAAPPTPTVPPTGPTPSPPLTQSPTADTPASDAAGRPDMVTTNPAQRSAPPTPVRPADVTGLRVLEWNERRVSVPIAAVVPTPDTPFAGRTWGVPADTSAAAGGSTAPVPLAEAAPTPTEPPASAPPLPPPAPVVVPPAPPPAPAVAAVAPQVAPPAVTVAPVAPTMTPATVVPEDVAASLDKLEREVKPGARVTVAADVAVSLGVVATAGYVLLSPRTAYWLLSAALARRTVWSHLDPMDVVFAWEQGRGEEADDESLESMVGK